MGAARSGWSMLHQSAFLLALRNAAPGTECASGTSVPHFLVDRPFALVWLYFSWLPRWRDSFRVLGGSLFGVPSTDRGSRLRDMSNFCCLPGRAGGTPLLVRSALPNHTRPWRCASALRVRATRRPMQRSKL